MKADATPVVVEEAATQRLDAHLLCCADYSVSLCGKPMVEVLDDDVPNACRQCEALDEIGFCPRGIDCSDFG